VSKPTEDISPWPDWLVKTVPDVQVSLESIAAARNRLWQVAKDDYLYDVVGNRQLNVMTDELVARGILNPKGGWPKYVRLPRELEFAQLNRNAINYRILGAICAAKRMACVQLVDATQRGLSDNSLLVAFMCLRSLLEQIAHFDALVTALQKSLQNDVADKFDEEVYAVLIKAAYATRVDWSLLLSNTGDIDKRKFEYKQQETRADRKADSILNAIDGLTKHIKQTRAVYEALCEFAHPNVGLIFGLTRKLDQHTDAQGVHWMQRALSMDAPVAGVRDISVLFQRVFNVLVDCMKYFECRLIEATEQREVILKTTRVIIRRILEKRPDLILPYSLCPCGGGKKTKFCCGDKEKQRDRSSKI